MNDFAPQTANPSSQTPAPAWQGYMSVSVHRASQRLPGHLSEISRYGGVFTTTEELPPGERVTLGFDLDREFEAQYGAPDLVGFEAEIVDSRIEEGAHHGQNNVFRFPAELRDHYGPWIETIAPGHGLKPAAGSRFSQPI